MKITIVTGFFAKGNMDVNTGQSNVLVYKLICLLDADRQTRRVAVLYPIHID
jgi:hypothetical protein